MTELKRGRTFTYTYYREMKEDAHNREKLRIDGWFDTCFRQFYKYINTLFGSSPRSLHHNIFPLKQGQYF